MCTTTADITDRNGAIEIFEILGCTVKVVKRNEMHVLRLFLKDGLWKGRFLSWKCRRL